MRIFEKGSFAGIVKIPIKMNLSDLHTDDKPVSAKPFFKDGEGTAISIRIAAGETLKEHVSNVPAVLICIEGECTYSEGDAVNSPMHPGTYVEIASDVKHAVTAQTDVRLLLVK